MRIRRLSGPLTSLIGTATTLTSPPKGSAEARTRQRPDPFAASTVKNTARSVPRSISSGIAGTFVVSEKVPLPRTVPSVSRSCT